MEAIHKKLLIVIIVGSIQVIVLNILFWGGGVTIEAVGKRVSVLGNKKVIVSPPQGMTYIDNSDSLSLYETEGLSFILKGDSLNPDKPTVFAEIYVMDEINSLEKMSAFLDENSEQEIVFNRIQGSSLNVILLEGLNIGDSAFTYCRYLTAYPYFLRIRCHYNGGTEPPEEVLTVLKAISLK